LTSRFGYFGTWNSRWVGENSTFGDLVHQDFKIVSFLNGLFRKLTIPTGKFMITRYLSRFVTIESDIYIIRPFWLNYSHVNDIMESSFVYYILRLFLRMPLLLMRANRVRNPKYVSSRSKRRKDLITAVSILERQWDRRHNVPFVSFSDSSYLLKAVLPNAGNGITRLVLRLFLSRSSLKKKHLLPWFFIYASRAKFLNNKKTLFLFRKILSNKKCSGVQKQSLNRMRKFYRMSKVSFFFKKRIQRYRNVEAKRSFSFSEFKYVFRTITVRVLFFVRLLLLRPTIFIKGKTTTFLDRFSNYNKLRYFSLVLGSFIYGFKNKTRLVRGPIISRKRICRLLVSRKDKKYPISYIYRVLLAVHVLVQACRFFMVQSPIPLIRANFKKKLYPFFFFFWYFFFFFGIISIFYFFTSFLFIFFLFFFKKKNLYKKKNNFF